MDKEENPLNIEWYDWKKIRTDTYKSGDFEIYCDQDSSQTISYIEIRGTRFKPRELGISEFQIWDFVRYINHRRDIVDRERRLEKTNG